MEKWELQKISADPLSYLLRKERSEERDEEECCELDERLDYYEQEVKRITFNILAGTKGYQVWALQF